MDNLDHPRTKGKSRQPKGRVARWHKTMLREFSRITFHKKLSTTLTEWQADLARGLTEYNEDRVHQGRWGYGRTPRQTFLETIALAKEKGLAASAIGH